MAVTLTLGTFQNNPPNSYVRSKCLGSFFLQVHYPVNYLVLKQQTMISSHFIGCISPPNLFVLN